MKITPNEVMSISPIVPVIAINDVKDALPLAKALSAAGVNVMEVTLRTEAALEAIKIISQELPSMNVGAGTVTNKEELEAAIKAGSAFIFSPGISDELIKSAKDNDIALIPGVSNASEVMLAKNNNLLHCKLFPASLVGGVDILKAFSGPFSQMKFCPTGGVNLNNMNDFLSLQNVLCIGGSWIVAPSLINEQKFDEITKLARQALENINK